MSKVFLTLSENTLLVEGVTALVSVFEKEVVIKRQEQRLVITGQGLSVSRLELEQGIAAFTYDALSGISFGTKRRLTFSSLFK